MKSIENKEASNISGIDLFNALKVIIKLPENYKPGEYQTIGGMWAVDTWQYRDILFQVMDEGWFEKIIFGDKKVFVSWGRGNSVGYENTNEQEFIVFANNFIEELK